MSVLKTIGIQHLNGSSQAVTLQPNNNVTFANNVYISGQTGQVTNPLQIKFSNDYPGAGGASSNTADKMKLVFYDNSPIDIYSIGVGPSADMQYHAYQGSFGQGSHNFYTENLLRMKIDGSGRITMPYQPVASVSYGGGDVSATNIIPLNTTPIVRGGMTISSNRITVPVAGTYMVGYHHLGTNTGCQIQIRLNGSAINSGSGASTQINPAANHGNGSVQNPVAMSASDYIEFYVINNTVHGNSGYNRMYVYLLG